MFQEYANAPCNNTMFLLGTIPGMEQDDTDADLHPSAQRLYLAAKVMQATQGKSNLARLLNESPQMVNNWAARGVSATGALKAQAVIGCNANWLLTGEGGMLAGWPFSVELKGAVAGLDGRSLARLENVMRLHLDLAPAPAPAGLTLLKTDEEEPAEADFSPKFRSPRSGKRQA